MTSPEHAEIMAELRAMRAEFEEQNRRLTNKVSSLKWLAHRTRDGQEDLAEMLHALADDERTKPPEALR